MTSAIVNGKIIFPDGIAQNKVLVMEDDIISSVSDTLPAGIEKVYNAEGCYVSPGFIDIHTHGGGGFDFMDGTVEAIEGACRLHLSHGTTTIVPTTLTCLDEELLRFFEVYRKAKASMKDGPKLAGIHLEGPYFSREQCGAQDPKYLRVPREHDYMHILNAGGEDIVRVSAAPELDGAMELGRELKRRGILAAIGHSNADYPDVKAAVDNGYSHITHLYSCMSSLHRVGPYRVLGITEAAYLLDELTVEIIADGKHLPPELLRLIVKNKPLDSICLITDSMRGAGLPDGRSTILGSLENGQESIIRDGVAMLPDMTAFAGSVCTADRCIRTMHKLAGVPLHEAVKMMTQNPARIMGLASDRGALAEGMSADICLFDKDINIKKVFVNGRPV